MFDNLASYETGYLYFTVNTTEKDSEYTRTRSTFFFMMSNLKGKIIGGHFADFILTDGDYGVEFKVPLDSVSTYYRADDLKAGVNKYETNYLEFINENDKIFISSFYNATEWANIENVYLMVK